MSELSVFIDESGNLDPACRRHLTTLVFHDQSRPIDAELVRLGSRLRDIGFPPGENIHAGPAIRREGPYAAMDLAQRKRVIARLHSFVLGCGVSYRTFAYLKSELGAGDVGALLQARLARDVELFLRDNIERVSSFDRVIVYYDNGQHAVAAAVRAAFGRVVFGAEFRLVVPSDYRLFQAADLICTLELLRIKAAAGELSRGELAFFGSASRLHKNYLRQLDRLRLA